jgi:hypothetical protein
LVPDELRPLDLSSERDGSWSEFGVDELLLPELFSEKELFLGKDLSSESEFFLKREISTEKEPFLGEDLSSESEFSVRGESSMEKGWFSGTTRNSGALRQPIRSSERRGTLEQVGFRRTLAA